MDANKRHEMDIGVKLSDNYEYSEKLVKAKGVKMSVQDVTTFQVQLNELCEFWRAKLTHVQLVGTLDTIKVGYHIKTIEFNNETERCETPVIKGEQTTAPEPKILCGDCKNGSMNCPNSTVDEFLLATGYNGCGFVPKQSGSPIPAEVEDG